MPDRPRLTPATAQTRGAVRALLPLVGPGGALVALSGGPDSLALAAAAAFEGPRAGVRIGAIVVDHGMQPGSAGVAERAAAAAAGLGLDPVLVRRVEVDGEGGPEAAARTARYDALRAALAETGASHLLLGHTLDDQAETVLLGLARGSGPDAVAGMRPVGDPVLRPFLGLRRATTVAACADQGLEPWADPMNADARFARARVRAEALPALEAAIGPGVAEALARTADQVQEDAAALDAIADELAPELAELAEGGIALPVPALAANPPAIVHRLIRLAVEDEFGRTLSRAQTLAVARLVFDWHGQGGVDLPGIRVVRADGRLEFLGA
ncbi:tRNA lysidine(34) synthetase TilS [Amnibacterium kyonggiense]|uniref:tRNA(Ile)-lysidine synthase n=1 Tax=Amnibacterium kyonggiense TaxID=595671 RepID=A0A4R7FQN3_9MICO|nr:tRNA lysidine(34) synthetase TilS [Amnibacterium kyonggiense]TDS80016.1 tRNA(Ile)-lysidine synthase [Amnibacterium kyonggiense]